MRKPKSSKSVILAIVAGWGYVNGPAMTFLMGPVLLVAHYFRPLNASLGSENRVALLGFIALMAGFAVAWCWWAFAIPQWRIWAYERVDDIDSLDQWACDTGLGWPNGSPFARTEFKSRAQASRERALAAQKRSTHQLGEDA